MIKVPQAQQPPMRKTPAPQVERRFRLLGFIAELLKFFSVLVIVFGIGLAILMAITPTMDFRASSTGAVVFVPGPPNVGGAVGLGIGTFAAGLLMLAFGELIRLQIEKEQSARLTNELLLQLFRRRSGGH